jgi:hypothetical protein
MAIARAMGRALARLHDVTWPHGGSYEMTIDSIRPLEGDHAAWIAASME